MTKEHLEHVEMRMSGVIGSIKQLMMAIAGDIYMPDYANSRSMASLDREYNRLRNIKEMLLTNKDDDEYIDTTIPF